MVAVIVGTLLGTLIALAVWEFWRQERKKARKINAEVERAKKAEEGKP